MPDNFIYQEVLIYGFNKLGIHKAKKRSILVGNSNSKGYIALTAETVDKH